MHAVTYYPGSCGEIIQGNIKGIDMLISCPVNLYTSVKIYESKIPQEKFKYRKSNMMLKGILKKWGYEDYFDSLDMEIISEIPVGKGFASSTADLCGTYYSVSKLFNRKPDIDELLKECIGIEPTDSIIFKDMTLFDYKYGKYYETIGDYIELYLLVFEGNKIVDTVEFNSMKLPPLQDISLPLSMVKAGVKENNVFKIAEAGRLSIFGNQNRVCYEIMPYVEKIRKNTGGIGIFGGHSGDVLAVVYDEAEKAESALKKVKRIEGYKCYLLRTLRGIDYENNNANRTIKRQR